MKDVIYHSDGVVDAGLSSGASSLSTMSAVPVTDLVLVDRSPVPAWSGGAMAVTVDRAAAVERLPGSEHQDPHERLALAFLVSCRRSRNSLPGPSRSVTQFPGGPRCQVYRIPGWGCHW